MTQHSTFITRIGSPIGTLRLTSDGTALTGVYTEAQAMPLDPEAVEDERPFEAARSELDEYFTGVRTNFDLRLALEGTAFQRAVWRALVSIPHGTTLSYSELAERVGRPGAARAVGRANAKNPLSIVVPCHRVIGADGSLTGYAGGLPIKRWLLAHEGAVLALRGQDAEEE